MTTVKVKLRPSTVPGKPGTLYYQLIHNRQVRQITTAHRLQPCEWDPVRQIPLPGTPQSDLLRECIRQDLDVLRHLIRHYQSLALPYTVDQIVRDYRHTETHPNLLAYFRRQITLLRQNGQIGTAKNYERTLSSLTRFLGGTDLPISFVTETLVSEYSQYLERRGLVRNSISFYMRILRAVYNKAVRQHLVHQFHPFQQVYTGIDRTRKRAVREQLIAELNAMVLKPGSPEDFARDLFIFSYCTRGMAFVDIAYLRTADLRDGHICYTRHKTRQQLIIKIEPGVRRIIRKYHRSGTPYVFPILHDEGPEADYQRYRQALNTHNRMLKKLSFALSRPCPLSSYTPRHSWATAARNHNVPLSVISAGLGHHSERTTEIYLALLENTVIDTANHELIKRIL